ncbi:RNA-directed DNA polymerase from mobile element jockey [Trichonephila clavipes]|nr:RNA-directed DNA polymerase from mobile element jockey [Trichonephila clavipes]
MKHTSGDSRFGRRASIKSIESWSERTDVSASPSTTSTGLGASPSRTNVGDDSIAEFSDVFREAINARNIYAAWARKLTNAKPSDPDVQTYHQEVKKWPRPRVAEQCDVNIQSINQEVKKAGETVEALLIKLNVPLFKIPATGKELDKIVFRLKNKSVELLPPKNQEAKKPAAVSPPLPSLLSPKGQKSGEAKRRCRRFCSPPSSLLEQFALPARPLHPPHPLLPRLLLKTCVWKVRKRKWNFRNQRCKIRSWCPRTKAPMPLIYLQIENGVDALKIFDLTELFGTRVEVKSFYRGNKINHSVGVVKGGSTLRRCATFRDAAVPLPAMQGIDATAVQIKIKNSPPINIVSAYVRIKPVDNTLWRKSSLLRKPFRSIPSLQEALGSTAITPIEKAEVIADSLQEQFEHNHVTAREDFDQRIHAEVENFLATPHVQEIEPTTPTEVLTFVQRIKPKKSPGLDQISNRMIKNLPLKFLLFITLLINQLFKNNYFPDSWKTAVERNRN